MLLVPEGAWTMRLVFTFVTLFALIAKAEAGPFTICTRFQVVKLNQRINGCVIDMTHNHSKDFRFWSESLCEKRSMYVYLPPGYDATEKYPVMIWLHGFIQDERDFLNLVPYFDQAIACGQLPPMIIAAPDGSIRGRPNLFNAGSFYVNSRAGRFEDFIACDVWNLLASTFPIRPEREAHALAGASMGGFGAYNLAIKYKDRFKVVGGFMPPLNMRYVDCHNRYQPNFDPNCFGSEESYRPRKVIGIFRGVILVQEKHFLDPLYGRNRTEVAKAIVRENPVDMIAAYDVKPGDYSFFIGYGGRDELNIDAQVESFLFLTKDRNLNPTVAYQPNGRHSTEAGIKMIPEFNAWLDPLIRPYAPATPMK